MKKYLFTAIIFMLFISFSSKAQEDVVITGTKKLSKQYTPQQVIDSLNKRFPDAKSVQYFTAKGDAVNKGWKITEEDNLPEDADLDYYTISFKREGMTYYGLYDKDGHLLQSKAEASVSTLPAPVQESLTKISEQHPGYTILSKTYYKNQNHANSKEYYEVVAEKGKEKKRLYYAPDGTLIKVKG